MQVAFGNTLRTKFNKQKFSPLLNPSTSQGSDATTSPKANLPIILSAILGLGVIIYFYQFVPRFSIDRSASTFEWLRSAWNGETDYEHGVLFPFVIIGLIIYQYKNLRSAVGEGSWWGLVVVFVGALLFAASYRTLQPRIAAGALPMLLWGGCYFLWGWRVAKILAFPLFFFWLAVPLPSFQQATTHLQLIATSMAHHGSSLFGVETQVEGTTILPVQGDWEPLDIATGCSGIRSLMALIMISAAWAYVANIKLWQKVLLFASALPLAIIGNALRVTSIFVIAEYGDAEWAAGTWHDWSGLLLFYPFSLFLLLVLHSLFQGGLPWKKGRKKVVQRKIVGKPTQASTEVASESTPSS